jgi:hypothetical protein
MESGVVELKGKLKQGEKAPRPSASLAPMPLLYVT